MATLLVHIRIREGMEARFEAVAREMYRATHADEKGVRRYEYWRGAEPRTYYTLESFDDEAGFLAHQTSAHHERFGPDFGEMIEHIRLEWVDPVADAAPLVATEARPLRAGASAREAEYQRRQGVTVPPWWLPLRSAGPTA